ncbi:hypothetical protein LINPERHAP2_LOCUS5144 [Linum perenne]
MAAPVFDFDAAVVAESQLRYTTSLLGRCFLPIPKSRQWLQATLGRKWNLHSSGFRVSDAGFNLYQIFFAQKADLDRVMRRRPHSIDGCLFNLIPWQTPSQEVFEDLRFASFWVRLEGVPSEFRSVQFGTGLLQPIGQVLHTGLYDSVVESKEFIRGFVRLDVTQPFLGRRKARYSHGGEFWVNFGYEGLPTVCFGCGLLGHPLRLCPAPFADGSGSEDRGPWMQVERMTYHQVKLSGKKRPAADSASGGGLESATEEAASEALKLPRNEDGPNGLLRPHAQSAKFWAAGYGQTFSFGPWRRFGYGGCYFRVG